MAAVSEESKALLLRHNITQTLQIPLTRLKVYTYSKNRFATQSCHLCEYSSKFKSKIKKHLLSHTGEKPFSCTLCNYRSSHRGHLKSHIMTHKGEKHYACAFCKKSFTTNTSKTVYEIVCKVNPKQSDPSWVEMQKTFKCDSCPYSAAQKSTLKRHLSTHSESCEEAKIHKCQLCKYSSNLKSCIKSHLQSHSEEKPFSCPVCMFKSSHRQSVKVHIRTHTGEMAWNCAFCKKPFKQANHKTVHEKICKLNPRQNDPVWIEMQRAFKCQLCSYSAARKCHLKSHLQTHTGEKPFTCNICKQTFSLATALRSHIFTHTHEKPHNCQFCKRGFAHVTNQKVHEKVCKVNPKQSDPTWVEEQKKFRCHFCTYRTMTKAQLESHVRWHTGEKPYKCPLCLFRCSQNSNLHCHLKSMHEKTKGYTFSKFEAQKSSQ